VGKKLTEPHFSPLSKDTDGHQCRS